MSQLSIRHIAKIVRRKMITKIKPSGKLYNRQENKKTKND